MLSVEGVTHAPVDLGFQAGLDTAFGLRLFGGFGWVPGMYLSPLTGAAASATDDPAAHAILDAGVGGGTTWRATVGIRPIPSIGLYFDGGYSRIALNGSLAASDVTDVPGLTSGSYSVSSTLHMWVVELGYQALIADRLVLGGGVGVMGIIDANTKISAESGAASDPVLDDAASAADEVLESRGIVPTLTLRLGVDLI